MKKNEYVISCDFYRRVPKVNVIGSSTLALTTEFESNPSLKVYLRGHENMSEPRLNVKEVAEKFTNKKLAQKIASQLNKTTFDEGKIVCKVEKL